jgi:hypothetical protein
LTKRGGAEAAKEETCTRMRPRHRVRAQHYAYPIVGSVDFGQSDRALRWTGKGAVVFPALPHPRHGARGRAGGESAAEPADNWIPLPMRVTDSACVGHGGKIAERQGNRAEGVKSHAHSTNHETEFPREPACRNPQLRHEEKGRPFGSWQSRVAAEAARRTGHRPTRRGGAQEPEASTRRRS